MDGDKELIDISSSDEDNTERPTDVETAVRLEAQRQERLRQAAALHAQARRAHKTTEAPPNISHHQQEVSQGVCTGLARLKYSNIYFSRLLKECSSVSVQKFRFL